MRSTTASAQRLPTRGAACCIRHLRRFPASLGWGRLPRGSREPWHQSGRGHTEGRRWRMNNLSIPLQSLVRGVEAERAALCPPHARSTQVSIPKPVGNVGCTPGQAPMTHWRCPRTTGVGIAALVSVPLAKGADWPGAGGKVTSFRG